jgi:hypothetical protein
MTSGQMILWRFKGKGGVFNFGYVIRVTGGMAQIGPYNGASHGPWVRISEVETERYHA